MRTESPAEQLFFSTVHLRSIVPSGESKYGTGFLYKYPVAEGKFSVHLVTNKHVIESAVQTDLQLLAADNGKPLLGTPFKFSISSPSLLFHDHSNPNIDVTVVNLSQVLQTRIDNRQAFFKTIPAEGRLQSSNIGDINAIEAVLFYGYPSGIYDSASFLPVVRGGSTATPIENDYEGVPSFLIDASVFPGSSGSPVFLLDTSGIYLRRDGGVQAGSRFRFLGILAAVHTRQVSGRIVRVPASTLVKIEDPINLGIVFKASTIHETVYADLKKHGLL